RRGGVVLRVPGGGGVGAFFSSGEAVGAPLPRLVDGLCLLRLHPPHERCRHEPAPAFVPAAVARRGGVDGRRLILRLEFARPSARVPLASGTMPIMPASIDFHPRLGYRRLP